MSHARHHGAAVDISIGSALDDEKARKPSFHAGKCVINDRVISWHMKLELGDHSTTRRHCDGLDPFQRRIGETAEIVDLVEDLTDDMEGRGEIGSTHAEEKSYRFSDLGMQGMRFEIAPTEPLKTKYSGRSFKSFSTLNSWLPCWPNAASV